MTKKKTNLPALQASISVRIEHATKLSPLRGCGILNKMKQPGLLEPFEPLEWRGKPATGSLPPRPLNLLNL